MDRQADDHGGRVDGEFLDLLSDDVLAEGADLPKLQLGVNLITSFLS